MLLMIAVIFLLVGALGGFLVGVTGFGSTLVVLPTSLIIFSFLFPAAHVLKLAVGTTLACAFTAASISSTRHVKQGNVDWWIFRRIVPVYVIISTLGPALAHFMPVSLFHCIVGCFLFITSFLVLQKSEAPESGDRLLSTSKLLIVASLASLVTSMSGVATGVTMVPFLSRYLPRLKAVGTSVCTAIVGCGVAVSTYIFTGYHVASLPPLAFGYVYLPAYVMLIIGVALFNRVGFQVAHRISAVRFRLLLSLLLLVSGVYSIWLVF